MDNSDEPKAATSGDSSPRGGRKRKSECAEQQESNKRNRRGKEFLQKVDNAVTEILCRDKEHPPTFKDYMGLYSDVYENLVEGSIRVRRRLSNTGEVAGYGCTAEDIYHRLQSILKKKMRSIIQEARDLKDQELLRYYVTKFTLFKCHATFLDGIFSYMNRAWVKSINTGALEPKETIYSFCMLQWRNTVFHEFNQQVSSALLALLQENRSELNGDDEVVIRAVESYLIMSEPKMGSKSLKPKDPSMDLYMENLETKFLEQSKQFYCGVATQWVADKPVETYVKDVEVYLQKERATTNQLFPPTTVTKLMTVMLDEFVRNKSPFLVEAIPRLIAAKDIDSLKCMFGLLLRLEKFPLDDAISVYRENVVSCGQEALANFHEAVLKKEIEGKVLPIKYVDTIVSICRKYENITAVCLNNHVGFRTALDEAAVIYVNQNAHTCTGPDQYNMNKTPEILGRYSNVMLTSGSLIQQEDFQENLNKLFLVLKYTESKDSFEKYYNWHLLNRLIHKASASEENETSVITQMKTNFGQDYSLKSFQLTQDAKISDETSRNFKLALQEQGNPLPFDFHMIVFKNGSCKLPECPPFNLASELMPAMNAFITYYGKQYEGRTLTWYHNKSHGELMYNAGPNLSKKYTFVVSAYQMTILLLFNDRTTWSLTEIQETTMIDENILSKVLPILERTKLLVKNGSDCYELYAGYKSSKFKHDINVPIKLDTKAGSSSSEEAVNLEVQNQRKFVLQAAVVRIMKASQTMRHSDLIAETISAVSGRFKPNISQIKRTIDSLIEKEYLKRDENEADKYIYIS